MSDINTKLLQASLEMLRWADKGDYRPEFTAAVSRLQQAVFDAARAHRDQQLAAQRLADQLAKAERKAAVIRYIDATEAERAAIAKATGVQS